MHPALHSWREELPSILVRLLAYLSGLLVLSVAAAQIFQSAPAIRATTDARPEWIEIERPFPAFALSIPEANDVPSSYAIRRHAEGGGRKDILTLGEPNSVSPYLQVEIYRPGSEISRFAGPKATITAAADPLGRGVTAVLQRQPDSFNRHQLRDTLRIHARVEQSGDGP